MEGEEHESAFVKSCISAARKLLQEAGDSL
jgi:hypothetical protein